MSEASTVQGTAWPILVHSLRTAIACVVSLLVAQLFRRPEAYWAVRGRRTGDRAVGAADRTGMGDRISSNRRSFHRNWRRADVLDGVAGEGSGYRLGGLIREPGS